MSKLSSPSGLDDIGLSLPIRPRARRYRAVPGDGPIETPSINHLRDDLLVLVKDGFHRGVPSTELESQFEARAKKCLRDESGDHPTLLHWILWRADHEITRDQSWSLKASLELVRISLKIDPEMMTVQDNRNDTALHKAVTLASTSNYEDVASLAICMCKSVPEDTIRKALSVTNYRGETSIHIAVVKQLEIASMLIQRADQMTLLMQRNSESNGIPIVGGGNTALHDAVAYERCLSEESNCTENELCQICAEIHEQMWDKRNSVLELLEMLMCRAPSALTITNSADESPYLYHQSTKIRQQDPSTQPGKLSSRTAGNKLTAKTETATRVAYSVSSHIQDADSQPTTATKKPGTAGRDNTEKGKGLSTATSGASTAPKVTDRVIAPSESGSCPAPVRSDRIATEVEGYLLERAFTLGGFKEACKCFFGKKRDKNYKNPNFRPGHAIGPGEEHCYQFLEPPSTMSQVDLIVPLTEPEDGNDPNIAQEHPDVLRELWSDDMASLRNVFQMLRNMGVRRILKLMVKDNLQRPCSDEVIKECLKGIDIRYLDWRKEDLSADVVLSAAPNVVELWLYSSGRSSVLRGWSASNGVCNLNQMTTLHLDAHWGLESYEQYFENIQLFEYELKLNILSSRARLFQQYKIEICKKKLLVETNRIRHDQQDLEMISGKLASLRSQQTGLTAVNSSEQKKFEKNEQKIKKLEFLEGIRKTEFEDSKAASNELNAEITSIIQKIDQLDHDRAEREYLQIQSIKSAGRSPRSTPAMGPELPTFFWLDSGAVVSAFTLEPGVRARPKTNKGEESNLKLEDSDVREAPIQPHRWLKSVDSFVSNHVELGDTNSQDSSIGSTIKVALIDDGVDANLEIFKGIIHSKGWPSEEPTSEQYPFYHSAAGHGTAMAKLIKRICPRVELHVAKLGQWTDEVTVDHLAEVSTAKNAAEAVDWAIQQGVQIISMSWSLISVEKNRSHIDLLDKKIQEAAGLGIIMYCAAADEALYGTNKELYPAKADTQHIRAVGSAQENGRESVFVNSFQVDYLFPGEGIDELGERKGSSAATALASGLAALILWCFVNHEGKASAKLIAHPKKMHHVFTSIKAKDSKWVDATRLFRDGSDIGDVVTFCRTKLEAMD